LKASLTCLPVAAVVALAVLWPAPAPGVPAVAEVASARFRAVCHFPCGRLAAEAERAAEAVWPLAAAAYGGGAAGVPTRPLEIHLYRTAESYRSARSGFLRPAPQALATTDPRTRTAHIALLSTISDATLERYGLPPTVVRVVAHEAFHLAGLAFAPQSERYPAWYNEGGASHAEQRALARLGHASGAAHEPVASTYAWLLQGRVRSGTLPGVERLLADDVDALPEQERYALRAELFAVIEAAGLLPALDSVLRTAVVRQRPSRAVIRAALQARLARHGLERLEAAVHERIMAAEPTWAQAMRSLDSIPDGWLQIGLAGDAEAWQIRRWPAGAEIAGRVELLPGAGGVARLLVGTAETGHLVVELDGAASRVRVLRSGASRPAVLAEVVAPGLQPGRAVDFAFAALDGELRGAVAGGPPLSVALAGGTLNGAFGVGASEGTNVLWRGLSIGRP
jgi:hypothetical protein